MSQEPQVQAGLRVRHAQVPEDTASNLHIPFCALFTSRFDISKQ